MGYLIIFFTQFTANGRRHPQSLLKALRLSSVIGPQANKARIKPRHVIGQSLDAVAGGVNAVKPDGEVLEMAAFIQQRMEAVQVRKQRGADIRAVRETVAHQMPAIAKTGGRHRFAVVILQAKVR